MKHCAFYNLSSKKLNCFIIFLFKRLEYSILLLYNNCILNDENTYDSRVFLVGKFVFIYNWGKKYNLIHYIQHVWTSHVILLYNTNI